MNQFRHLSPHNFIWLNPKPRFFFLVFLHFFLATLITSFMVHCYHSTCLKHPTITTAYSIAAAAMVKSIRYSVELSSAVTVAVPTRPAPPLLAFAVQNLLERNRRAEVISARFTRMAQSRRLKGTRVLPMRQRDEKKLAPPLSPLQRYTKMRREMFEDLAQASGAG